MNDIRNTNIRFNLSNPQHQRAWEYLQTMNRSKFKSYSHAVVIAINDYFERLYKEQKDPYFETREREELFVKQIVDEVGKQFSRRLPEYLTVNQKNIGIEVKNEKEEIPIQNTGIDWDFIGKG